MDESSLRENIQLEKLRALHHSDGQAGGGKHGNAAENSAPQRKPGLASVSRDPSGMGRELQDEVDERVRQGTASEGEHCDRWIRQAEQAAARQRTHSEFVPTKSSTPLEIFVTVHLKAKTLKRLLAKVGALADVCMQRGFQDSGNMEVYTDAKGHSKGNWELVLAPEQMSTVRRSTNALGGWAGKGQAGGGWAVNGANAVAPGKLPALVPIETSGTKRDRISNATSQKKLLQDGSVFQGLLNQGRPNGLGTVVYNENDPKQRVRFAGEFEEGIRRGTGCLLWKDGAQYAGDWFGDKPSGFGVEKYPDGSSYVGQYEEDMRHGYGTYTFPSGAKYEGCWFMGKRHGQVCCVMK